MSSSYILWRRGSSVASGRSPNASGRSPNTRVQRTRSSPSALRAPLTRRPLGSAKGLRARPQRAVFAALPLLVMCALAACARRGEKRSPGAGGQSGSELVAAEVLARAHEYDEAWLRGDWPAAEAMLAADYYVFDGVEGDLARLRQEFPKIKTLEYKQEQPHVKILAADLILVNHVMQMRETYDGKDISGRYWYSQIWVRREGRWLLLVEQELPMPSGAEAAQ